MTGSGSNLAGWTALKFSMRFARVTLAGNEDFN